MGMVVVSVMVENEGGWQGARWKTAFQYSTPLSSSSLKIDTNSKDISIERYSFSIMRCSRRYLLEITILKRI